VTPGSSCCWSCQTCHSRSAGSWMSPMNPQQRGPFRCSRRPDPVPARIRFSWNCSVVGSFLDLAEGLAQYRVHGSTKKKRQAEKKEFNDGVMNADFGSHGLAKCSKGMTNVEREAKSCRHTLLLLGGKLGMDRWSRRTLIRRACRRRSKVGRVPSRFFTACALRGKRRGVDVHPWIFQECSLGY